MGISKLDTVKDKEGKRFRVADVHAVDGQIIAVLKGVHADGSPRRGGARQVRADVLEAEYTRIDLPPVTIRKIDDLSEEDKPVVKEPTPSEKAAQIEKEAVRELSKKDIEKAVEASTFGGKVEPDAAPTYSQQFHEAVHEAAGKMADENDQLREINNNLRIHIMEQNKEIRKLNKAIEDRATDNNIEILKAELLDMKKTISKMQQAHEAEVQDLKDQLSEAQALANAATKYKDEVVAERNQYSEALDDDSVTFEAILDMARVIRQSASAVHTMAARIEKETEGRI